VDLLSCHCVVARSDPTSAAEAACQAREPSNQPRPTSTAVARRPRWRGLRMHCSTPANQVTTRLDATRFGSFGMQPNRCLRMWRVSRCHPLLDDRNGLQLLSAGFSGRMIWHIVIALLGRLVRHRFRQRLLGRQPRRSKRVLRGRIVGGVGKIGPLHALWVLV
jgi:hypothetical protein